MDTTKNVEHPKHYKDGKFECIDVMVDVFGVDSTKDFCILNAFKYIWRFRHKNGIEDVRKARWYLDKYLELAAENTARTTFKKDPTQIIP